MQSTNIVISCAFRAVLQFVDEIIYPAASYLWRATRHVKENIGIKLKTFACKNRKAFPDKPVPCRLMAHSTCTLMSAGSLQFTNTEPVFRTVLRKQFYGPAWMGTKLLHLTSSDTISHTAQFELLRWSSMRLRSDCRRSSDGKFTDLPTSALRPMPNASVNIRTLSC